MPTLLPDMVERYMQLLLTGDAESLLDMFTGDPVIDDPIAGRVRGADAVREFVAGKQRWLAEREAHLEYVRTTRANHRTVTELEVHLEARNGCWHLPVAVVGQRGGPPLLESLAVYHSTWPLTGEHAVRPPVLEADAEVRLPDIVRRYHDGLEQGYLQAILECFAPDAYVREPSGGPFVYRGDTELREYYLEVFGNYGGVQLDYCRITDDEEACALEYNVVKWGRTEMPAQAGVTVFERNGDGLIQAVRIYNDVKPPLEA